MSQTGKIALVLFENAVETYEHQMSLMSRVDLFKPESGEMQNADNVIWRTVQQHAPILEGWDLTGDETDIIEETVPSVLMEPLNDFVKQRADNMRDMRFWERRGKQSGLRQATELNKRIAELVKNTGSLYYRSNTASGFDFISEAQALINERQVFKDDPCFVLNDRSTKKYASDLAGRQTLQGRPESEAWAKGQIGANVAEFDVFTSSSLPNLLGGVASTTTTAALSFKPESGSVDQVSNTVTNVDYRRADIPVVASAAFNIGDKVSIGDLQAIGLADKTPTNIAMTFSVVAKPDATTITVFPKPIAADDAGLTDLQKAYANVDTTIGNGDTVTRLNIDASVKTNIFWSKDSIEVLGGDIPAQLLKEYDGMKVISKTMENGQVMYMVYDGKIEDMSLRYRLFTWYGLTNLNPMANGVAVSYT